MSDTRAVTPFHPLLVGPEFLTVSFGGMWLSVGLNYDDDDEIALITIFLLVIVLRALTVFFSFIISKNIPFF